MARIRNIKPEFFRHEALQDLEAAHPCAYIMLTYVALWTQCDKNGVFAWKPRIMALDILPFLGINIEQNLQILLDAGYIQTFENQETKYGYIPTFNRHQILPTKEKLAQSKYPNPPATEQGQSLHSPGTPEEGRRKKEEGERENAHAHEDENSTKKNENTPKQPSNGGGNITPNHFDYAMAAINAWARSDNWQPLRDLAASVGYQPDQYGPVADEVKKFTAYYLDTSRHPDDRAAFQADPARFFQEKGRKWLLDAKNMNRQRPKTKDQRPTYTPPPHQRQRHNGNAHETTVGDIAGKIITEIAQ